MQIKCDSESLIQWSTDSVEQSHNLCSRTSLLQTQFEISRFSEKGIYQAELINWKPFIYAFLSIFKDLKHSINHCSWTVQMASLYILTIKNSWCWNPFTGHFTDILINYMFVVLFVGVHSLWIYIHALLDSVHTLEGSLAFH